MARPGGGAALLTALLGGAVFIWWRSSRNDSPTAYAENPVPSWSNGWDGIPYAWGDDPAPPVAWTPAADPLAAFLYLIRNAEHTRRDALSGDAYATLYGGRRFADMSDHPTITGEWMGAPLSDVMCRNAGQRVGCKTTAAGAYQIIRPTWDRIRRAGSYLSDFGPAAQDEASRRLLRECGALARLEAGDVEGAIAKASAVWASLPGNTYAQGGRSLEQAILLFNEGLNRA